MGASIESFFLGIAMLFFPPAFIKILLKTKNVEKLRKCSAKFLTLYNSTTFAKSKEDLRTFMMEKVLKSALFAISRQLSRDFGHLGAKKMHLHR